ncbi:MAG: thiamine phosphate synthase [Desulfobacteraceae bacterium]|nr:thiamine phosphate synthase [Desulfobacteraceae bacterium]
MKNPIGRGIDANLNRVSEGLRVVEDICRFVLANQVLQQKTKTMRHSLNSLVSVDDYLSNRNARMDVGRKSSGDLENSRSGAADLVKANSRRVQEGLRSLEEFFKLEDVTMSGKLKSLRYQAYDLEKAALVSLSGRTLKRGLYLILTDPPHGYETLAQLAVDIGLPAVQLRYKGDDDRIHYSLACRMREITAGSDTLFIVNDRPDIAMLCDADGVHMGQTDLPVDRVRRLVGDRMLLGLSTHNISQVQAAKAEPVDYIGFGPLFTTTSKAVPDPVVGPEKLADAVRVSPHPVVAIGGLTLNRIRELDIAPLSNAAVIRAVAHADDPQAAIQTIHHAILEMSP